MDVLAALADPVRREIVETLADGEIGAGDIAARFPVSRPAISRHLRVLREAGLVVSEVRGQRREYRLVRAPLADLDRWLGRFRPLQDRDDHDHTDDHAPTAPPGPAGRLDALDTEIRRGRRRRPASREDDHDDRTAG